MQFLQIILHFNVAHIIEQHARIQGTSSSGGIEQAQMRHMKWHWFLQQTMGTLKVIASQPHPIRI
jgi:hypothetical protein